MARFARAFTCVLVAACLVAVVGACRGATEIDVELTTDVKCVDLRGSTITIGGVDDLESRPVTTQTPACDEARARIGSIVVVPSAGNEDTVAIRVVAGLGRDPNECKPPAYGPGCIVARRALRFVPHETLSLPILLAAACNGIACGATETCVQGDCRSEEIPDPSACKNPAACGEGVLAPGSGRPDAGPPPPPPPPAPPPIADAGHDAPIDAGAPDPTKVTISYAAGKNAIVYAFDSVAKAFAPLPSAGCPSAEESAVFTDGSVYITSSDNTALYRLTATGCTPIKTGASFPYALTAVPRGTLSASSEELAGYIAPDYVKVDRTTGAVTTIGAGVLGTLLPSGDVAAYGTRGFLAARTGTGSGAFACPAGGDCIVEVNLATGALVAMLSQVVGQNVYGLAHGRGKLLLYTDSAVLPYDLTTKTAGAPLASFPAGASFSGAGAAPY
jgi:hypothetical protein